MKIKIRAICTALALLVSSSAHADRPQLYAGLGIAISPGAERPVGLQLDSSLRWAPGEEFFCPELGPFLQAGWMGGREFYGASGLAVGFASVQRSDSSQFAYVQADGELGLALWQGAPRLLAGAGVAKALSPYFKNEPMMRSYALDSFLLRLAGAALLGAEGVDPLLRASLQGAWMPRIQYM